MDKHDEKAEARKGQTLTGYVVMLCIVVFAAGMLAAVLALSKRDWSGVGSCLTASAISAGFLLNAMTRS